MALLAYLAAVIVTVTGMLLGMDWLVTPPDSLGPGMHTATSQTTSSQPTPAPSAKAAAAASPRTRQASTAQPNQTRARTVALQNASPSAPAAAAQTGAHCDIQACESAYHSFRASDCTYQPFNGPRRQCNMSSRPTENQLASSKLAPVLQQAGDARAEAHCNVAACSSSYRSFRASDCTYQPMDGGARRLCER